MFIQWLVYLYRVSRVIQRQQHCLHMTIDIRVTHSISMHMTHGFLFTLLQIYYDYIYIHKLYIIYPRQYQDLL